MNKYYLKHAPTQLSSEDFSSSFYKLDVINFYSYLPVESFMMSLKNQLNPDEGEVMTDIELSCG